MTLFGILHHLFIPHTTNNHRPKVLHVDALLFYVLLFAIVNFSVKTIHRTLPDVLGYATDIHLEQLMAATNAKRTDQGLPALTLNSKLSTAAAAKAQDMFAKNYWSHSSPTGATPWEFIQGAGYRYTVAGENLAKNFSTSQTVVDAWMASPTHRDNILKPGYKEIGFAIVNGTIQGEETTLVVQMFGASNESGIPVAAVKQPQVVREALAVEETPQEATPVAAVVVIPPEKPQATAFLGVTKSPLVNIPTLKRNLVYLFGGVLLGVLAMDAWIITRRRIVRVAGHNIAHFLFLSAVIIAVGSAGRGVLL